MLTRNCYRVLLLALLLPGATMALGLGDIHLKSSLNAPLAADIDIVGAGADELSGLKASLASRDTFSRYKLEYPSYLAGVTLEPRQTPDGRTVLHMHSADSVNEPIATLLVEVNWARGHLVREYTVLLDPPVFSGDTSSAAPVAAPGTGESARSGNVVGVPTRTEYAVPGAKIIRKHGEQKTLCAGVRSGPSAGQSLLIEIDCSTGNRAPVRQQIRDID